MPRPVCPPVAADVIIEIGDRVVFIERKNDPPGWTLPGGFVEFGETVEQAAVREALEETGLEVRLTALLGVYSRPDRDPRGRTIGIVYIGSASGAPRGHDDARDARLFTPAHPPAPLAFDHAHIIADYLHWRATGEFPGPWRVRAMPC
jgi:8-oxo-dGTP diphosphatase